MHGKDQLPDHRSSQVTCPPISYLTLPPAPPGSPRHSHRDPARDRPLLPPTPLPSHNHPPRYRTSRPPLRPTTSAAAFTIAVSPAIHKAIHPPNRESSHLICPPSNPIPIHPSIHPSSQELILRYHHPPIRDLDPVGSPPLCQHRWISLSPIHC